MYEYQDLSDILGYKLYVQFLYIHQKKVSRIMSLDYVTMTSSLREHCNFFIVISFIYLPMTFVLQTVVVSNQLQ